MAYYLFARDTSISFEAVGVLSAIVAASQPVTVNDLVSQSPDPVEVVTGALAELVRADYVAEEKVGPEVMYRPTARAAAIGHD